MAGAAAIADLFGPPVVELAVAVEPLPLAALRVVVGATRDVELAVARQRHEDLRGYIEHSDARYALQTAGLHTEIRRLRRRLAYSEADVRYVRRDAALREEHRAEVDHRLARDADDLSRWVARYRRMPTEVAAALYRMRRPYEDVFDEHLWDEEDDDGLGVV
jgi:hypothetical protein